MENTYFRIPKCKHNDSGYCKYGEECRKRHFKTLCSTANCDRNCQGRHPRECRNGGNCKFFSKNICAYKHVTLADDCDEVKALKIKLKTLENEKAEVVNKLLEQIDTLVKEIEDLKAGNKMLEANLKRSIALMHEKEFESIDDKDSHKTVEQTEENCIHACEKCEFKAHSNTDLNNHISVKHTTTNLKRLFLCDHCNFATNLENKFKNHQEINHGHHHQKEKSTCNQCDFICETEHELEKHTESKHGYLSCDICDEFECEWDEIDAMDTHKELFHEFKCNVCDYETITQKGLNIHKGAKHKHGIEVQAVKETSICEICLLTFPSEETLRKHRSGMHQTTLTF
jgi:hypothetical protein